jgi:hypothetical protein
MNLYGSIKAKGISSLQQIFAGAILSTASATFPPAHRPIFIT